MSDPASAVFPWFVARLEPAGRAVLSGELDIGGLDALRAVLDQALLDAGDIVAIDASDLSFIDSAAIRVLLRYELVAAARGKRLWLSSGNTAVVRVLDILDLNHILLSPTLEHQVTHHN
jgi:anti-anti-sigma factor